MKCAKIKLWQLLVKKEESEASWRSVLHVGMNNFPEVHKYTLKKGRPVMENSIFNWSIMLKKGGQWLLGLWVVWNRGSICSLLLWPKYPVSFIFFYHLCGRKERLAPVPHGCTQAAGSFCSVLIPCVADILQVSLGHCGNQINLRCWRNAGAY